MSDGCSGPDGGERLSSLRDKVVEGLNKKYDLGPASGAPTTTSDGKTTGGTGAPTTVRTTCRPSFKDGDRPTDVTATLLPSEVLDTSIFDSDKE